MPRSWYHENIKYMTGGDNSQKEEDTLLHFNNNWKSRQPLKPSRLKHLGSHFDGSERCVDGKGSADYSSALNQKHNFWQNFRTNNVPASSIPSNWRSSSESDSESEVGGSDPDLPCDLSETEMGPLRQRLQRRYSCFKQVKSSLFILSLFLNFFLIFIIVILLFPQYVENVLYNLL